MKKIYSLFLLIGLSLGLYAQDNLYLIGSACSAGWSAGSALAMTKDGDVFTWTGELNPGELKFLSALGSWDNAYGSDEYDKCIWNGGDYTFAALTDGDRKFQIKLRGTYTITINGGTIHFTWTDRIYPVGDGCTAGWNPESGQYLEANDCCSYKGKVTFTGSGEFKLLCQQNWGDHYGPKTADAALSNASSNDIEKHTSDDYKFNVGISGEYDVVLDVWAGKLYVGTILPSVTIKAQFDSNVSTAFGNSFNLYLWTAMGASNTAMTLNDGWYEATVENVFAPYNFLFNKATNDWSIQTPNVENNTAASLCMHVTNTGSITATVSEGCEDLEESGEFTRPAVKLLGIGGWDVETGGHLMTDADDHSYCSCTVELAAGTHEFKIYTTNDYAYNGADYTVKREYCTDIQLYSSGMEPNVKLQADLDGNYTFVYYYDTRKLNIIYPELPESIEPAHYLKGLGGDWGGIFMTPSADGLSCSCTGTLTAQQIESGWQQFKVYYKDEDEAEHWMGGDITIQRNATSGTIVDDNASHNAYLKADFAGNYVFTFTYATQAIEVTFPEAPEVDLKGINGEWTGVQMTEAADRQSCSYTYTLDAGDYEFKIFYNLNGEQWLGCGYGTSAEMTREYCTDFLFTTGTENCILKADYYGDYTFTYDYVSHKVSVAFPERIADTYNVRLNSDGFASIYLDYDFTLPAGVNAYKGQIEGESIVLTQMSQDVLPRETGLILYSASIKDNDITLTQSFEGAASAENNDFIGTLTGISVSDVYVLAYTAAPNSTAFYHMSDEVAIPAHKAYLKVSGGSKAPLHIRFATEVTTGNEQTEQAEGIRKVLSNGRVIILVDGHEYNILGQIVK